MTTSYMLPLGELIQPPQPAAMSQSQLAQAASLLLSQGLTVECVSNPALSGTYPADTATLTTMLSVQVFIDRNARFPGGTGAYIIADVSGNPHVFTVPLVSGGGAPPSFTQLVYALADFAAACSAIVITGTGTLPPSTVTIA